MSAMEKAYDPAKYEAAIYDLWEQSGAFKPAKNPSAKPFSIIMPPPNANGNIHVGTAMFVIEDILTRYHRMRGDSTLWLPGTDHAGIETQVVFERDVLAKRGQTRFDLGPKRFYDEVLAFTKEKQDIMLSELKSLGFSADWSRLKFTLDPDIVEIVYDTFQQLHRDGLVYRGSRIVNWCPHCRAGFADIEIKHRQQVDPLYYIKYGPFVLATVRPETKFGDTAIAVHPDDERYQKYIGQTIKAEDVLGSIKLKVIADDYVNPDFGTGVVKVTPAHDPNDWEMGQRHHLEVKQVIGTDGRLTGLTGKYAGMGVDEARQAVAADLEARGLIDHIDMNYSHNVAIHDRCGTQIEPLVTEQWWLRVDELKKPAIKAIQNGEVKFVPARFKKQAIDWLENLHDWNISRQIWWGIPIPVYYNSGSPKKDEYIVASREIDAEKYFGKGKFERETDTFDTWFSSSQWPFATLMSTGDLDFFYPTTVMETGREILFLWVTRMIMLGLYRTGKVPFKTVYIHGTVNDAQGKKMSKSRGNVLNPLDVTKRYGTDALRLTLAVDIPGGKGGSLDEKHVEGYRNFCNKLWNVARFILDKVGESEPGNPDPKSLADQWILHRISQETSAITRSIEAYRFSEAGERVYGLLWNDLADWYIEASKVQPNNSVLVYALESVLKLAHPFTPFVTEAIWQKIPWQKDNLIVSAWPQPQKTQPSPEFEQIMALVSQIRAMASAVGVNKISLLHNSSLVDQNQPLIKQLARVSGFQKVEQGRGLRLPLASLDAWLDVAADIVARYATKLKQQRAEAGEYVERLSRQLDNKQYLAAAPTKLVAETRERHHQAVARVQKLDEQLENLRS